MSRASSEISVAKRRQHAALFAALGDETRLSLVNALAGGVPRSIAALSGGAKISRQAITKHLQSLAVADLIDGRRSGREHLWALNPSRLTEAQRCLDQIARHWDDALSRLKTHLEES